MIMNDPYIPYIVFNAILCLLLIPTAIWLNSKSGEQWLDAHSE